MGTSKRSQSLVDRIRPMIIVQLCNRVYRRAAGVNSISVMS